LVDGCEDQVDGSPGACPLSKTVLRKEPNGQVQEPSGHRSVKIKDLRVSWKWPVCNKIFRYGKGVPVTIAAISATTEIIAVPVTIAAISATTEIYVQKPVPEDFTFACTKCA